MTSYRYLDEMIGVLAARAPGLQEALERALEEGNPVRRKSRWRGATERFVAFSEACRVVS